MMKTNSFYPVILTKQVALSSKFYTEHFGFEKTYEADWYVSLRMPVGNVPYELALSLEETMRVLSLLLNGFKR